MQLEILGKKARVLRTISHNGQMYAEAPKGGEYKIRITNNYFARRLVVVSVDGVNVLDGKTAGFDGQGYVLRPWETIDIPGYRRSDDKVAKFEFREQGESYAAQTGRGTSNVGVIGVAVFDELVNLYVQPPRPYNYTLNAGGFDERPRGRRSVFGATYTSNTANTFGPTKGGVSNGSNILRSRSCSTKMMADSEPDSDDFNVDMKREVEEKTSGSLFVNQVAPAPIKDVGTAYGRETTFNTVSTTFIRATKTPALVLSLRYATLERLKSWGVPIEEVETAPKAVSPFPASMPAAVPAPAGWRP